jgi:uncharacterized protein (DUF4415 family)
MKKSNTNWDKLREMGDSEIDKSDIPELDKNFFRTAEIKLPKNKKMVSIRLDDEVLSWYKSQGPGYQTKINEILKMFMAARSSSLESYTDDVIPRPKVIFDTNTFHRVLEQKSSPFKAKVAIDVFISHAHYDELMDSKKEFREKALGSIFTFLFQDKARENSPVWHFVTPTDTKRRLGAVNEKTLGTELFKIVESHKCNRFDASIVEDAIKYGFTLVTENNGLAEIAKKFHGTAKRPSEFLAVE